MAKAVRQGATFTCPHSGTGTIASASGELKGSGSPIINKTEALTMIIAGCTFIPPPAGNIPCTALVSVSGESSKLTKKGVGVILDNSTLTTNTSSPSNTISITESVSKITAV
ncbi:MAG: hypothetical protein ACXAC2_00050 [Candidatus Kariarchaeaceae archaeon]|jgi:hypothetical protein